MNTYTIHAYDYDTGKECRSETVTSTPAKLDATVKAHVEEWLGEKYSGFIYKSRKVGKSKYLSITVT